MGSNPIRVIILIWQFLALSGSYPEMGVLNIEREGWVGPHSETCPLH